MPLVTDATGNQLTYQIIGFAMKVHNELGRGYNREVYEKALAVKLEHAGIEPFHRFPVQVKFEGQRVAAFSLDLFPRRQVVIMVKAFSHLLTRDELAQAINLLKASGAPVGLVFNFGRSRLDYWRVFPGMAGNSGQPREETVCRS